VMGALRGCVQVAADILGIEVKRCVLTSALKLKRGGACAAGQGGIPAGMWCERAGQELHWLSHHLALQKLNSSTAQTPD
jgi:hypothetical protein